MYSDKKNILQLVALLIEHNIKKIVLCPGSRNSPIVHTIAIPFVFIGMYLRQVDGFFNLRTENTRLRKRLPVHWS